MSSTWNGALIQADRDGDYDTAKSLESSMFRKSEDSMGVMTGSARPSTTPSRSPTSIWSCRC